MKKYYYNDGKQNHGPFTLEEMAEKTINTETLVWFPELEGWQKAGSVPEIKGILPEEKVVKAEPEAKVEAKEVVVEEKKPQPVKKVTEPIAPSFDFGSVFSIFGKTISDPHKGVKEVATNPPKGSMNIALVLFILTATISLVWGLILSKKYGALSFVQPVAAMFIISALLFLVKAISGKPNFKNEILSGAISGIPFILLTLTSLVFYLLETGSRGVGFGSMTAMQIVMGVFFIMLANIIRQSLEASGVGKSLAWYFSLIIMFVSYFLAAEIQTELNRAILY